MQNVPEYNLTDPATFKVILKRDVISELEEKDFQRELIKIAGLGQHNQPNLVMRWGVNYVDPMTTSDYPKYYLSTNDQVLIGHSWRDGNGNMAFSSRLEDVPTTSLSLPVYSQTHLGERRFIVEQWRSPGFLEKSGRYAETSRRDPETGEILLREFPRQGCYDFFFRIERADGTYHPPDGEALEGIRQLWAKNQRSFTEKDSELRRIREREAREAKQQRHEIWHPDNIQKEMTV